MIRLRLILKRFSGLGPADNEDHHWGWWERQGSVCVWRGEGGWGVCLAFLHRTIRFRLILKRVNNSLGPIDKHWVRRRKGVACLAPTPTIPPQTIRFRLILKRVGHVGSHGCRHHHMQKSYHFLVDGEGQVDEMGLSPS